MEPLRVLHFLRLTILIPTRKGSRKSPFRQPKLYLTKVNNNNNYLEPFVIRKHSVLVFYMELKKTFVLEYFEPLKITCRTTKQMLEPKTKNPF